MTKIITDMISPIITTMTPGLTRHFTPMDSALMQFYTLNDLLTFQSGDTFEIYFLSPTSITAAIQVVFDGDTGSDRGFLTLHSDGTYNTTNEGVTSVDGVVVDSNTNYPTDGKLHRIKIAFTDTAKIKFLGASNSLGSFYNGILANAKATISGVTTVYPLDQTGAFEDTRLTYNNFNAGSPKLFNLTAEGNWLGQELVVNGNFSGGSTGWNVAGNWVISGGKASTTNEGEAISQSISTSIPVLLSFRVLDYVSGEVTLRDQAEAPIWRSSNGLFTEVVSDISSTLEVDGRDSNTFTGSVDDISARNTIEVA